MYKTSIKITITSTMIVLTELIYIAGIKWIKTINWSSK